jgi:hypothetical protein
MTDAALTRRGLLSIGLGAASRPSAAAPPRPLPRAPAGLVAGPARALELEVAGDPGAVTSAFGVVYDRDERAAAQGLWTAAAAGSRIAIASWSTTGFMGRLLRLAGASPAIAAWGRYESLAFTLAEFDEVEVREQMLTWRVADADELLAVLGGVPADARREAVRLVERFALSGDDGLAVRVGWLLTCARKPSWA